MFPKHKQILVRQQKEVVFHAVGFPIAGCLAIVLFFDYYFFEAKIYALKHAHYIKTERYNVTLLPRVTHENGTKPVFLQNTVTFAGDSLHLIQKILYAAKR